MTLLNVQNIETYYDRVYALRGVSMEIQEGGITAILGNNGAGKTTILNSIVALIDDQPEKGLIEFDGKTITNMSTEKIIRMGIGYVPEGRQVFNELTVLENIKTGAYTRKGRSEIEADIDKMFEYFPVLKERTKQQAGTLSGGEQQMLAIARALMSRPRLLMLDEPSLGLSPLLVKEVFEIIRQIHQDGTTILLVEQNAKKALEIADFGYILENGRFVASGTAGELKANDDVKEFYLGVKSESSVKGYQRYRRKRRWR